MVLPIRLPGLGPVRPGRRETSTTVVWQSSRRSSTSVWKTRRATQ